MNQYLNLKSTEKDSVIYYFRDLKNKYNETPETMK